MLALVISNGPSFRSVRVTGALPGGLSVTVHGRQIEAMWNHNDLTAATGVSAAAGDPFGYTWSVDGTKHVVYRGTDGHIHELWFCQAPGTTTT